MFTFDPRLAAPVLAAFVLGAALRLEAAQQGSLAVTVEVVPGCRITSAAGTSEVVACPPHRSFPSRSRQLAPPQPGNATAPLAVTPEAGYLTLIF